ncbi:oligoendopeptidase F [Bacillus mangrovi]|uniref:Oligopeptidase F n=1 Tax=Metabacillus mangrovi TaxID=1491830 RepID=A0A7X2S796_9BACI|nr:oligoendopeptidase F [Metabacillus mangrovi]MTH54578.1 oligoendopeptidase F [Metabacillus mangrovi]
MKKPIAAIISAVLFGGIAAAPCNVLSVPAASAQEKAAKPNYQNRAQIPEKDKWNLHDLYKSKAAWEADVKKAEELSAEITAKYQGKLDQSVDQIVGALQDYSTLSELSSKAYGYANLSFDVNQSNPKKQALLNRAEKMAAKIAADTSWLNPEIVSIKTGTMKKILRDKKLAPYKYVLQDMLRTKSHTLTKQEEEVLARLSPLSDTGTNVYGMLAKDVKFPKIKDSKGKEIQLTRSNYISYVESGDRLVRKGAYEAYYRTLGKFQDSFAQALTAQVKSHTIHAGLRNYKSALEAAVVPNDVPAKVYDQLISSVNKGLPLLHRYMELKKKLLGVDELHMYDMYTPIVEADRAYIPYEDAKKMVMDGLKPMGDDYLSIMNEAFKKRWIDVYSTEDKATGAYQWGSYGNHPFVLLNYQGTKGDVATIAHELGHAAHNYMSGKKQNYLNAHYAIFTAEVASTLNEALLWNSEYKKAGTKKEKLYLLNQRLENFRTTLFRQTQFAEFEKKIHELDQKGEALTAETYNKVYGEINQKYYGKVMAADKEIPLEWARIPHFYNYNFYVYQYATSFAASTALSKQIADEGAPAVKRIKDNLLSAGGSSDPISILKNAGVDMSSSEPVDQAMKVFEETLNEMEKLVNES